VEPLNPLETAAAVAEDETPPSFVKNCLPSLPSDSRCASSSQDRIRSATLAAALIASIRLLTRAAPSKALHRGAHIRPSLYQRTDLEVDQSRWNSVTGYEGRSPQSSREA